MNALQSRPPLLKNIDCYGSHLGIIQGIKGRVSSFLHWNTRYDERNLAEYRIIWAQQQPQGTKIFEGLPQEFKSFFAHLKSPIANFDAFTMANSNHLARILYAFKENKDELQSAFDYYYQLGSSAKFDFDAFIAATNKVFSQSKDLNQKALSSINSEMKALLLEASQIGPKLKNSLYDNLLWETACVFWTYKYEAIPVIDLYLNALTGSALFSGFWGFVFGCALAELSLAVIGSGLKGGWNSRSVDGALSTIIEEWNQRIEDENSFHPFFEIPIASLYIATTWLYIDKLQKAAKAGDILHALMQWGIKDYVLKYSTMHFFFAWKSDLHKGIISTGTLFAALMGAIRGVIRNPMANFSNSIQTTFKLSEGLALLQFGGTYLSFWATSVPKTIISSPASLITCLWIARDAWEVFSANFSSVIMQLIAHFLPDSTTIQLNFNIIFLSSFIIAVLAYYDPQIIYPYSTISNSST